MTIRLLLIVLFLAITPLVSFGQSTQTFNTPGTSTFKVPAGVTSITVEAWGAGGGGSDSRGGGGGAFAGNSSLTVTPGLTYVVTVGAGGSSGNDGQDSSFGTLVIAKGATGANGGLADKSTGTIRYKGGDGGSSNANTGAGGGGSGGSLGDGQKGDDSSGNKPGAGGKGGSGISGDGGAGGGKDESGKDGVNLGGGGGSKGNKGTTNGNGGNGRVIVSWNCPTYSLTGVNTATATCKSDGTSIITLKGSTGLPVGTYTVTYNTDISYQSGKTATMTVLTAGTGTFTATGLTIYSGVSGTSVVTVTNIASGTCSNAVSVNNTAAVTVFAGPVGGGVYSGTTPICLNSSTGTMTLGGGYVGNVVNWEKRLLPAVTWTTIANTSISYSESPSISGTWEYRAIVGNGPCATTPSGAFTVVVNPLVTITLASTNTTICQNTTTATLSYSATTGSPVQWQIDFDAAANTAGVGDQNNSLGGVPGLITIQVPYNALSAVYNGILKVITYTPSCSSVTYPITVTVNPNGPASVSIASSSNPICSGTPVTFTALPTNGGANPSYQWKLNGTNVGTNSPTYANALLSNGSVVTCVMTSSSTCATGGSITSNFITTIVNTLPSAPIVGTITNPTCVVPTGILALSGLPSTGNRTIIVSPSTDGLTGLTGIGATATVGGLVAGTTYTFAVSNGTCTSLPSANVPINNVITTTYNGSTWSTTPDITMIGIIDPPSATLVTISSNTELCSCTVNTDKNAAVASGITLKLQDRLTVLGTGKLTFNDQASLVQINDAAVNTGNIIYKRFTNTAVSNTDYTYWSAPVSPLNLGGTGGISYNPPGLVGSIFYSYEVTAGSEDWKSESAASSMIVGQGYSIRGPGPILANTLAPLQVTFTGKPNNGRYAITGIFPYKSYLIGNPYPSALDADKFLTDNAGVVDGTLYFWTHTTKIGIGVLNPGTGVYAYSGNDYASYNLTGGTGNGVTYPKGGVDAPSSPGSKPTGKIGAGQGFFATSNTTIAGVNEIVFNNSMRVGVGGIIGDNTAFFKIKSTKSKTTSTIEKNRVWLNLTNTEGAFKQLLVGYITGATNEYDNRYDGETFDGNEFIDFYSVNQDKNLVIQGRALPFDANDEVPLGYRSAVLGDFIIGVDEVDGLLATKDIFLEDKDAQTVTNLKEGAYTFTTEAGTFNDRFVLRYTNKTLGTGDFDKGNNQVLVSVKNKQIKINSSVEMIDKVQVYDLLGRQLFKKNSVNNNEFVIVSLGTSEQALLVKIILQNGAIITRKIMN